MVHTFIRSTSTCTKPFFVAAKHEYIDLKRELSRVSRMSSVHAGALESGNAASDEFNLDEFLNGLREEHASAGHLPKNLGVSWKNLTVKVRLKIFT